MRSSNLGLHDPNVPPVASSRRTRQAGVRQEAMADTRLTGDTFEAACRNPGTDTYDGLKAVRWLFEATTGKPMSDEEARDLWEKAKEKRACRK